MLVIQNQSATLRPACLNDLSSFLPHIKEDDRQEALAMFNTPVEYVLPGMVRQPLAFCIEKRDTKRVVAVMGASPSGLSEDIGSVWLVTADGIEDIQHSFLRYAPSFLDCLHKTYPVLFAFVWSKNALHRRWLQWCGFHFVSKLENFGANKETFYEVIRKK
jgi:hypothetical protein